MKKLRLKGIAKVSFVRSVQTNLNLYRQSPQFPGELREGEAYLFISKMGNQVVFIFRPVILAQKQKNGNYVARSALDTRRVRLDGGTWSPYMIAEYARLVGLELENVKSLGEILEERRKKE